MMDGCGDPAEVTRKWIRRVSCTVNGVRINSIHSPPHLLSWSVPWTQSDVADEDRGAQRGQCAGQPAQAQPTSLFGIQESKVRLWMESEMEHKCGNKRLFRPECSVSAISTLSAGREEGTKLAPKLKKCRTASCAHVTMQTGDGWDGMGRGGLSGRTEKRSLLTTRLVNLASAYIYLPIFPFSPLLFGAFAS